MITLTRLVTVATIAVAAIACSSAPDETVSVDVDTDQTDPNCVRGGIVCGVAGGAGGGLAGGGFGGGFVLDPAPTPEPSATPSSCGEHCEPKGDGCKCGGGAGYGLTSGVVCSGWTYPCPRSVNGIVRCYKVSAYDGQCH